MLHPRARTMLTLSAPAILIGVAASLLMLLILKVAALLQALLWRVLPATLGISDTASWWAVIILTLAGVATGLVIRYAPGHAGPDPATEPLIGAPLPLYSLPGLGLALVICLAGGVSLGPEHPIMAINIALAVSLGARIMPKVNGLDWTILAAAGTIGALFGTPVAAALIFSQTLYDSKDTPLWDRLFAPLMAAAAGALTTQMFVTPHFALPVAPYTKMQLLDIVSGSIVAIIAIAVGMVGVWVLPRLHHMLHQLRHPVLILGAGGLLLGLLACTGGDITLFRGLEQMRELAQNPALGPDDFLRFALVKLAALVVATASGFRGGRIFPAVFIGASLGLMLHAHVPAVPAAITLSCAVLGMVLVVSRDGWLSLFMAAAVVPNLNLLPLLCIIMLPAWLLLAGKPLLAIVRR
ncbi:ion channel protein [Shimwellia pseudoproteus]|uniref:ion channel protein n=1 Tax=Shimwellia pseudoproteus TaxID=570012 RepID=UPI0018EBA55A|nr:ion channel protein [Shimwellia pseudoproteus]MBJ3815158.1 ion channel protein [Shimwellia pseudoproteus]